LGVGGIYDVPRRSIGKPLIGNDISGYHLDMTTTPQEPMPDPDVIPSGDPPPIETPRPGDEPNPEPERP